MTAGKLPDYIDAMLNGLRALRGSVLSAKRMIIMAVAMALLGGLLGMAYNTPAYAIGGSIRSFYGDGSDLAGAFDGASAVTGFSLAAGTYTATRDTYFTTMAITGSAKIKNANFVIYGNSTCTITLGSIDADGLPGTTTGGAALAASGTLAAISSAGASGRITTGAGAGAGNCAASAGGGGATGGTGGGVNTGGSGGAASAASAAAGTTHGGVFGAVRTVSAAAGTAIAVVNGGAGAGAGGLTLNTDTARSGSGGAGGSVLVLRIYAIVVVSGTISAYGGAGSAATSTGDGTSIGGGGGGGGGGLVHIICETYSGTAPTASVGTAGAGRNGGGSGTGGTGGNVLLYKAA